MSSKTPNNYRDELLYGTSLDHKSQLVINSWKNALLKVIEGIDAAAWYND